MIPAVDERLVECFADGLVRGEDAGLLLEQLRLPAETVMMEVLAPAARLLGARWCEDQIDFVAVTIAMSRLHQALRQLRDQAPTHGEARGRALLMPVPGEQHSFGLRLVEELLRRDGWEVAVMLAPNELTIRDKISSQHYDLVGFSISGIRLVPALAAASRLARAHSRNRQLQILAGGAVFADGGLSAAAVGVDAIVNDARAAVAQANRWLAALAAVDA